MGDVDLRYLDVDVGPCFAGGRVPGEPDFVGCTTCCTYDRAVACREEPGLLGIRRASGEVDEVVSAGPFAERDVAPEVRRSRLRPAENPHFRSQHRVARLIRGVAGVLGDAGEIRWRPDLWVCVPVGEGSCGVQGGEGELHHDQACVFVIDG